ncbi:hypothetical protein P153DRAFT_150865 [Dothidotthia symphoricarpi CBS 119687]|uniref:Uncharacterized protein n=1 Tax=Dothidotthia symphoricarpi CBS 119687 TaxID=1392245 RepID=A0A6A6ARP1_9PLEO|nr:uncharacterized protein P153DRAFT_150865 [Dothidotthia symphoricarpi CBS 119687]KAF2133181.1 hypothetical protein P153DRAFT_150865 [Dothidotthia symphoricarpi CBS 119687]
MTGLGFALIVLRHSRGAEPNYSDDVVKPVITTNQAWIAAVADDLVPPLGRRVSVLGARCVSARLSFCCVAVRCLAVSIHKPRTLETNTIESHSARSSLIFL